MLDELYATLRGRGTEDVTAIKASAMKLPLSNSCMDVVLAFNCMHHFEALGFLDEVRRVLRHNGYLFVYTRLSSQNKRNIWGMYFPNFHEEETRLYELEGLKQMLEETAALELASIKFFKYRRMASLDWLLNLAVNHHYSTFCLYSEERLEKALQGFKNNIRRHFEDLDRITWDDENVMLIVRKDS